MSSNSIYILLVYSVQNCGLVLNRILSNVFQTPIDAFFPYYLTGCEFLLGVGHGFISCWKGPKRLVLKFHLLNKLRLNIYSFWLDLGGHLAEIVRGLLKLSKPPIAVSLFSFNSLSHPSKSGLHGIHSQSHRLSFNSSFYVSWIDNFSSNACLYKLV